MRPHSTPTSYDGKNYSYLNDTRLAQVSYTDVSGTHLYQLGYDALGRCVRRTTGGISTTYYIYDGERPIYEFDPSGGTPSTNVYGRGIDEIIGRSNNGAGQYPMQDRQGSVILVTGGDGTVLESYRYDAFGAPTMKKPDGTVITTGASLINNRFLFTGREYAADFEFYEYRARAYHPGIGRFMSEDPGLFVRGMVLGKGPDKWTFQAHPDEAELNLFRYCNNDPWDLVDPLGLEVQASLEYYLMPEAMNNAHQNVVLHDTTTGQTVIGRGMPSEFYKQSSWRSIFDLPQKSKTGEGNVKLQMQVKDGTKGVDPVSDKKTTTVPGSVVTLKDDMKTAVGNLRQVAAQINDKGLDYRLSAVNSNSAASTAYNRVTGQLPSVAATSGLPLPGANLDVLTGRPLVEPLRELVK